MARSIQQIDIDGHKVWVEMEAIPAQPPAVVGKFADTSNNKGVAGAAVDALQKVDIAETLQAVLGPVQAALTKVRPEEISVEISLGFKADIGVFIASGEASAQVKVSAKWKPS